MFFLAFLWDIIQLVFAVTLILIVAVVSLLGLGYAWLVLVLTNSRSKKVYHEENKQDKASKRK